MGYFCVMRYYMVMRFLYGNALHDRNFDFHFVCRITMKMRIYSPPLFWLSKAVMKQSWTVTLSL